MDGEEPMSSEIVDERVARAISHWGPRFVSNGVPVGDFLDVGGRLRRWDEWCSLWSDRAKVHEALGEEALKHGWLLSAGEHFNTAGVCFHFAKFLFVEDPVQMRDAHERAVACRQKALPYLDPPGERVEVPYEAAKLTGILRKPHGVAEPPVVLMAMGLDSAKEEMGAYEETFLKRGMATLAFDGPGQGEAEYHFPIRPDYEVPVGAMVDWLERRPDVDQHRIGLWGVSLGGYYAARAAAYEKRIKACVALSGPYDFGAIWSNLPQLTRAAFQHRARCRSDAEAREAASRLNLSAAAPNITCPIFVVAGKKDRIIPWQDGERLASEVVGAARLKVIEDGGHVCNNRSYAYRPQTADWMAAQLDARIPKEDSFAAASA